MKKTNKKNTYVFGQKHQNEKIYKTFLAANYNVPTTTVKVVAGNEDIYTTPQKNYYVEMAEGEALAYQQMLKKNEYFMAGVVGHTGVIATRNPQLVNDVHALYETYPQPLSDALSSVFFAERFMHDMATNQIDMNEVMNAGTHFWNKRMAGKSYNQLVEEYKVK